MNYLKLLREEIDPSNYESIIEEGANGKKNYFIQGPMIVAGMKNKNGREYEEKTIIREVGKFATSMNEGRAAGELGHPQTPEINLDRISHYITELEQDSNIWVGKAKIATTLCGMTARALIEDGYKLGMSTRGLGSVDENGIVGDNFKLVTIDIVSEPSGPGCFVDALTEAKQWLIDESGRIMEVAIEKLEEEIKELPKKKEFKEAALQKAIQNYFNNIKGK